MVFLSSEYKIYVFSEHKLYAISHHFRERHTHHKHDVKLFNRTNQFSIILVVSQSSIGKSLFHNILNGVLCSLSLLAYRPHQARSTAY
jgi:hypothetical protein